MDYKKLSFGLGIFSLALGAAELLKPRGVARALDAEDHEGTVKTFSGREIAAGVAILAAPANSATIWNRVAGDALDLGALALAARRAPGNRNIWGAIAFVVGATVLDVLTARGLDRQTGKFAPVREPAMA
jgi:hypothetical protein